MKKIFSALSIIIITTSIYSQNIKIRIDEYWNGNKWVNSTKSIGNYNIKDDIIDTSLQNWNLSASSWENASLSNYEYNTNGTFDKVTFKLFNNASNLFELYQRSSTVYNNQGKKQTGLNELWINNTWQNAAKIDLDYYSNGYIKSELIQMWDQNNWTNSSLTDYLYNLDGTIDQVTTKIWNKSTNQWENYFFKTFTYNNSNKVLTEMWSMWEDTKWVKSTLDTNSYNANGSLATTLGQNWSKSLSIWENREQTNYFYNQNGTINQVITDRSDALSKLWNNWQRSTYTYENNLGIQDLTKTELKIFPNPTTDFINIHLEESDRTKVSIIDVLGRVIRKENFVGNDFSLNVMNLNKDVYFLKIERDEKILIKKIIKN